ncbi:MAG: ATP-binding protein [Bacteroidales bacterium]|nr:ATP-binding protein [Bacteroidales bacterium]
MKLHSLEETFAAIGRFCSIQGLSDNSCFKVNLICEELVVNLFQYSRATEFDLDLSRQGEKLMIKISYQAEKFDPTRPTKPETAPVEDLQYGGLGLVLVNTLAESLDYSYDSKNALNVLSITL